MTRSSTTSTPSPATPTSPRVAAVANGEYIPVPDERGDAPSLAEAARSSWLRFRAAFEPLRPELYRYCRHLTSSPWDAEDLVQDTLMRALVTLGSQYGQEIRDPRAWLLRVASNVSAAPDPH